MQVATELNIPALSIRQPYVHWIQCGLKTYEIRSWTREYRGELLICSSKTPEAFSMLDRIVYKTKFPLGQALCVVELEDIIPFLPEHATDAMCTWRPDLYAWKIRFKRNIASFPVKGKLGLFHPTPARWTNAANDSLLLPR